MSEVVGYTISIQESVEFLLTNKEMSKMEIQKILFIIAPIKYLKAKLTKEVKDNQKL